MIDVGVDTVQFTPEMLSLINIAESVVVISPSLTVDCCPRTLHRRCGLEGAIDLLSVSDVDLPLDVDTALHAARSLKQRPNPQ